MHILHNLSLYQTNLSNARALPVENTFLEFKVHECPSTFFIAIIFDFEITFVGVFPEDKCIFKLFNKVTKITPMDLVSQTSLMILSRYMSTVAILVFVGWFLMNSFTT